jgi:integrase/recombinase XerC
MEEFNDLIQQFSTYQKIIGKAPRTIERSKFNLRLFNKWLVGGCITKEKGIEFILYLKEKGYKPWSINSAVSTLRVFIRYLHQEKKLLKEDFSYILRYQKTEPFNPTLLTNQEIEAIFTFERKMSTQHSWFDARKYSFCFELMARCGLRVDEVLNLKVGDLNFANQTFTVVGKGRRLRTLHIPSIMYPRLLNWVLERKLEPQDWLFQGMKGNRIGYRSLVDELKKRARLLGINIRVHPHLFRHCFITSAVRADVVPAKLMKAVGHTSVQSYFRYTHLVADDIIDVFEKHPLNKIKEESQVTPSYLYKEKLLS